MDYQEVYEEWLNSEYIDSKTKKELKSIKDNKKEIEERFYKDLEFGTAGMRGIIGNGTNRMNKYTVTKATQGLANYIKKNNPKKKPVVISYDSRHFSKEFSEETALCLNANGIKTYVFEKLAPVPELSFAVRNLKCIAGVMITASHNPAKYNGYKVYWDDGSQIVDPVASELIAEVNKVEIKDVKTISKTDAINKGLYNKVDKEIEKDYINTVAKLILNPDVIKKMSDDLTIVYTPLHGAGNVPVQKILKKIGFKNVYVVPEQEEPDGDFPTVEYPNPESKDAFKMALDLGKRVKADVVLATDPDADRLGVYAINSKTKKYQTFTGNMSALLIAEYELSQKKEKGMIPKNGAMVKSIVSSNLADAIAEEYGLKMFDVLTGFKYIGEKIKEFEEKDSYKYMFGFEESYGCLIDTYARDKDGVAAVVALCEAAAYYKDKGLTLCDQMEEIYKKYGYYKEETVSITKEGKAGLEEIANIMESLRNKPVKKFGRFKIVKSSDFKTSKVVEGKKESKLKLPKSNVLYYDLENNGWVAIRPSGTEPKIKLYFGVKDKTEEKAIAKLEKLKEEVQKLIKK